MAIYTININEKTKQGKAFLELLRASNTIQFIEKTTTEKRTKTELEDQGLVNAMKQGEVLGQSSRKKIFDILES